jgi:hypothetical protein
MAAEPRAPHRSVLSSMNWPAPQQPWTGATIVDQFLPDHAAVRVARHLATADFRRAAEAAGDPTGDATDGGPEADVGAITGGTASEPFRLGVLHDDGGTAFDLDRVWFLEVVAAMTSSRFLERLAAMTATDPGSSIELGAHELVAGDAVGWHHDARRGQRLGFVYFALTAPVTGGQLRVRTDPAFVAAAIANRLVVFDATVDHAVDEVRTGVRHTLVGRTHA